MSNSQYGRHFGYKESHFGQNTKGHDVKAFGNTTGKYMFWAAAADTLYVVGTLSLDGTFNADNIGLADAETLTFGTGSDVVVQWDGTNLILGAAADDSLIEIGDSAATQLSFDMKWYGNENNGASYLYSDASANLIYTTGIDFQFKDNDYLVLGTGAGASGDVNIVWDGTNLIINAVADDTLVEIGDSAATQKSFDLKWYGNESNGASYLYADASANLIYTTDIDLQFKDNDLLVFGTGAGATGDVNIKWDATNLVMAGTAANTSWVIGATGNYINPTLKGVLTVGADTDGFDVKFYGATTGKYFTWDQSENTAIVSGIMQLGDTVTAALAIGGGTSASKLTTATADKNFGGMFTESTATSGDSRGLYWRHYLGGTIATTGFGDAVRAFCTVTGTGYSYASGLHATMQINVGATVTGSGAGARTTLAAEAEARTLAGALSAAHICSDIGTGNTLPTVHGFMRFTDDGAVRLSNLAVIPNVSNGTVFAAHTTQVLTHSIKIISEDGTPYYIMCTDAATNRS